MKEKDPKSYVTDLVDSFRMILMNEDTDCGCEILCTKVAIEHAKIVVNELFKAKPDYQYYVQCLIELDRM
jgi:hypothetical protein